MRILRYNQLATKGVTYSRQQLRRKIAAGEFPKPITLDDREERPSIAWLEDEIDGWILKRMERREQRAAA
jgi:predicted DNA-binding transcriptional regulator AlpA